MSSIVIDNLGAGYNAVRVLENISIEVRTGEIVALLGTNGNGKSTLMKSIMSLITQVTGSIKVEIDGEVTEVVSKSTQQIVDLGVALVPEGRRLFSKLTVEENLLLGAYRPAARAKIQENLEANFQSFPVLAERRQQLAGSMSGGEQQMLALARALMSSPRILLIDEPSVGLAPIYVARMIDMIYELKNRNKLTVLMAEQNFAQASRIADRGYVIVHGKIVFEGRSAAELKDNELVRELYLGI